MKFFDLISLSPGSEEPRQSCLGNNGRWHNGKRQEGLTVTGVLMHGTVILPTPENVASLRAAAAALESFIPVACSTCGSVMKKVNSHTHTCERCDK